MTDIINSSIVSAVPVSKPVPNAQQWWNEATLGPMKQKMSALRQKYQLYKYEDDKNTSLVSANVVHRTILHLKHDHWKKYLLELDNKTLFSAARLTNGPVPPPFIPPFRAPSGQLTFDPVAQANLLFSGTISLTIDIDLSNILTPPNRPCIYLPFTLSDAESVIASSRPSKAPGPDKIPSRVLQLGGKSLAGCIVNIANACLDPSHFPSQWKVARSVILNKSWQA